MNILFSNLPSINFRYPKIHKLSDGNLYLACQANNMSAVYLFKSENFGQTWINQETIATPGTDQVICNGDFCEDSDGNIHYAYNIRPSSNTAADQKFYIKFKTKPKNGSWSGEKELYAAQGGILGDTTYHRGCYEPSLIDTPIGVIVFFSNENDYPDQMGQAIVCRVVNHSGTIIKEVFPVTFTNDGRDGMFVPYIYKNMLVGCIEDYIDKVYNAPNFGTHIIMLDKNNPLTTPVLYNDKRRKIVIPSDGANVNGGASAIAISEYGETVLIRHNRNTYIQILVSDFNCDNFYEITTYEDTGFFPAVEFIDNEHVIVAWESKEKNSIIFKMGTITR